MRVLLIALLAAISYAQTGNCTTMGQPCDNTKNCHILFPICFGNCCSGLYCGKPGDHDGRCNILEESSEHGMNFSIHFAPNPPTKIRVKTTNPLTLTWNPSKHFGIVDKHVVGYEISLTDPWYAAGFSSVGKVVGLEYRNSSLLPDMVYAVMIRALTSKGSSSEWSKPMNFSTKAAGKCGNAEDLMKWKKELFSGDLYSYSQYCGKKYFLSRPGYEECFGNKTGISTPCSDCWFDQGICLQHYCVNMCLVGPKENCQKCWDQKCSPAFQNCTGMPAWTFPSMAPLPVRTREGIRKQK